MIYSSPGYNSHRRGTARTSHFTFSFVLLCMLFFVFCVLFVCKSVAALLPPGVNPFAVKYI